MSKTKIFLIANNGMLKEEHIERLNIDDNHDTVVLFNYMCVPYDTLKQIKKKVIFLRMAYELNYDEMTGDVDTLYLGGKQFLRKQHEFEKVVLVDGYHNEFTPGINIPYDILDTCEFQGEAIYEYPEDKSPTTGYLAYLYFKKTGGDHCEITLVGFTGHHADGTAPIENHHSYSWEQEYYTRNNVKRIYKTLDELQM